MSVAHLVPETWELTGDDARETLLRGGRRQLVRDAFVRFRASDGFSHARSLAFVTSLLLVQGVILLVGLAAALGDTDVSATIVRVIKEVVPGPAGKSLTEAVFHVYTAGASGQKLVLVVIGITTIVTGTTLMGQMERALNRLYGIEQDRPTLQKYGRALLLALTTGVLATAAFAMFALGHGIGQGLDDDTVTQIWNVVRWPIALVLMMAAIALLFRWSPNRHQPAWSWLAFGSTVSVLLWSLATLGLGLFFQASTTFSTTYGPLAGMIAILMWALLSSVAILFGAAIAVQLEAVRAGVAEPRDESKAEAESGQGSPVLVGTRERERARHGGGLTMSLTDWFLTPAERGNPATEIDRRHGDDTAWTEGNDGQVLVDGAEYFARLHEVLCECVAGDWVSFTDWQGDPDELLAGPGTEVGEVLAELAARGVNVRGLLWRSHPEAMNFGEAKNLAFSRAINQAGGQVLLDHRVRRGGSHHQKLFLVQHADPARDVGFVGGVDLCHGRGDDHHHLGDPQIVELDDAHYGERPPWHDLQLELRGPAVDDLAWSFAERWRDPNPLDTRNPLRSVLHRVANHPDAPGVLPPSRPATPDGPLAVQVLRTYPARRRAYPFAPEGERSIARAYLKAFSRARRLIYLEDQYLWSLAATEALRDALARNRDLQIAVVIPRYPDPDGAISGEASRIGRERVLDALHDVGHERVAVYDLENREGTPVYVHSKVCIVDDVWLAIGSDNLNRRSWTHDSELSCSVIDSRRDGRAPTDPAGLGDGARVLARDTRIRLTAEHLGRARDDIDDLIDPASWFEALRKGANALDSWQRLDGVGDRPPGHLREHPFERVRGTRRIGRGVIHATLLDPDGRPGRLRRHHDF